MRENVQGLVERVRSQELSQCDPPVLCPILTPLSSDEKPPPSTSPPPKKKKFLVQCSSRPLHSNTAIPRNHSCSTVWFTHPHHQLRRPSCVNLM